MPVSRAIAEDLARNLVELYSSAATRLTEDIARELRRDPTPSEIAKRAALDRLARSARKLLAQLEHDADGEVLAAVTEAYVRGGRAALAELVSAGIPREPDWWARRDLTTRALAKLLGYARKRDADHAARLRRHLDTIHADLPGVDAIQALAGELSQRLSSTHLRLLRWDQDVYRDVVARTSVVDVLAGTKTRLRAAQTTWEQFLARGVTGFTDKSGRNWELASYVEMATRTATAHAAVEGQLDRLAEDGRDLVIVSNAPQECKLCRPWEGKVLARTSGTGRIHVPHTLTGELTTVHVAGTIATATLAGLMHPNCRHSLSAYLPGVTTAPTHTEDPDGDAARQRQREIERAIRRWKLRAAGALTDEAKAAAHAKVRQWQAVMREHLADHRGLRRLSGREQIGVAR
jgi:hypothetical protein